MTHVVTILEARVAEERAADLQAAYAEAVADERPPGLVRSTLLRLANDPTLWRIETVWSSREALAVMRAAGGKPRGLQIFEAAGATPSLSFFEVMAAIDAPGDAAGSSG